MVSHKRRVLIVDASSENREVLATALERRGCSILTASRPDRGLELAQRHHPDVIVLDLEENADSPEALCAPFARRTDAAVPRLVVLGSVRTGTMGLGDGAIVAKPYHYAPLIRKIEELLDGAASEHARCA